MLRLHVILLAWALTRAGSLLNDLGGIILGGAKKLGDLVTAAWHAVRTLFSVLKSVFVHVTDAWHDFWRAIGHLAGTAAAWAEHSAAAIAHIIVTLIPRAVHWAVAQAVHLAGVALAKVEHALRSLVNTVQRALAQLVHQVWVRLTGWIRSIERTVTWTWHWMMNGALKAVDLVLHPERLAAWVIPHLARPLLRFIRANLATLARLVWQQIRGHEGDLARDLAGALTKLID